MSDIVVNLNGFVWFKLNDYGKRVYDDYFAGFHMKPLELKTDEHGYSEMQLWQFMEIFGPHIHMWEKPVIEPLEFVFEDTDVTCRG